MKVHFTDGPLAGQTLDTTVDVPDQQYPLTMPDPKGQLIEGSYTVSFIAMAGKWTPIEVPATVPDFTPKEDVK